MSQLIKNERITVHFRTSEDWRTYLECVANCADVPDGIVVPKGHPDYATATAMEFTYDSICDHSGFAKQALVEMANEE